jgi:hypothetical protein
VRTGELRPRDESKPNKRIYEKTIDGVRFTAVIGNVTKKEKSITSAKERVISFYSNRKASKGALLAADFRSTGIPAPSPSTHSETIAEASAKVKSSGVEVKSPVHVGSSAAGFVIGGSSGENGWSNERALLGAAGGFALASRFGKRDLRKTYDNAVKSRQAFDDITGPLGTGPFGKTTWKNTLSEGYEAIREARNVKLNVEANKLERLHKAIATEFSEAERKALHEYVAGETQTIAPHIKSLADHVKKTIDDLSKDLVNDGILSKEAYQEWAGKYIHRSYEKHLGLKGAITNIKQIPDYLRGKMYK